MLAYERFGHGDQKILALHGWMGDEHLLDPMRHALDQSAFEFVVPAYRGYGASAHMRGVYDLDEIVSDLGELIESLGWNEFLVIGHSMGGLIGQRLLALYPDRLIKLACVASVPPSGAQFDDQTFSMFHAAADNLEVRRGLLDFSTGHRLPSAWLDHVISQTASAQPEAMQGYLEMFARSDLTPLVTGIETPILVLAGGKEPMDVETVFKDTFAQAYPNATFEMLAETGHCPIDEAPIYVAGAVQGFFRAQ
ncbi:alpha/beta fold hydrolase [Sphingobium lactosutens]|uniref:AB hydrolase-1 domain-containing protein n=1 Tax=Sphingobium lactosutens DS20 TaxID=1331060 RepID=T0IJA6_9SPHN|nr:alpha/beta fold hydrolase [Sphingobium lactosutens]EQB11805.1 hypothetical protein RLDS_22005 [Sphingobium lactosutens DS20]